jgi:PRTRC genetic system protein C
MSKITTTTITRVFTYKGTEYPDPVPSLSVEKALEILSVSNPAFTNAALDGPSYENGKAVFQIKVGVGTKG